MNKAVMIVGQWSRAGGLEVVTQDIARALGALGWKVVVLPSVNADSCGRLPVGVDVRSVAPSGRIWRSLWHRFFRFFFLAWFARRELKHGGVLVICHAHLLPVLKWIKPRKNLRCWCWTHGIEVWGAESGRWKELLNHTNQVVAVSQFTARQETLGGVTSPIIVVWNSIDTEHFFPTSTPDRIRRHEILICGRMSKTEQYKGHEILFEALPLIEKRLDRPVTLRVVGCGDDEQRLRERARELGLEVWVSPFPVELRDTAPASRSRVLFCGRVGEAELVEAYQHCGVFAMPSRAEYRPETGDWAGEGFGLVYAEAESCGRPVVCSTDGGAPETIVDGMTGVLADPRDPQAVADAVFRILSDPDWSDELGRQGRLYAVREFSFDRFKTRVAGLLADA